METNAQIELVMIYNELIKSLTLIHEQLREQSTRAVNTSLTLRNWFFGYYIVEFEQSGKDKAGYGKNLLANIASAMKDMKIPNTDERELRRYRQFYACYPIAAKLFNTDNSIRGLLPPELLNYSLNTLDDSIRGLAPPEIQIPDTHYFNLFNRISYSHFAELIRLDEPLKRLFYEIECVKGTWSVKELKRQIGSSLFERAALTFDANKLLSLYQVHGSPSQFKEILKDPYVFEFLGLKPSEVLPEIQLEQAIIDHLMQFLLELGKGFCFEARQKRILIDNEHHFIDLVFYHRLLHCNVLIDLKTERFHHSHAGQLNMYLEYYKKYEMTAGDNPPVGILLCSEKDQEHVEFATAGIDDKLFVAKYLVALPDKKVLEQFIKKEIRENIA
jgi:predicted nuclease of restriction endonuclease-like (RecB) superfamily